LPYVASSPNTLIRFDYWTWSGDIRNHEEDWCVTRHSIVVSGEACNINLIH
jgi:hypothetical protein